MESEAEKQNRRSERLFLFVIVPQLIFLVLVIAFMYFYYGTASVSGDSMFPALKNGDFVLVAKNYNAPVRGDVIVYERVGPEGRIDVVKRVVAVAGDSIEVVAGQAYVNGEAEPLGFEILTHPNDAGYDYYVIPEDHVFVLGDNRPVSLDSRQTGPVPMDAVVGRAVFVAWPFDRIGVVDGSRPKE